MNHVIVHAYEMPDFSKIGTVPPGIDQTCEYCRFSEKTRLINQKDGYICHARLYDTNTLMCFVPDYQKMHEDDKQRSGLLEED